MQPIALGICAGAASFTFGTSCIVAEVAVNAFVGFLVSSVAGREKHLKGSNYAARIASGTVISGIASGVGYVSGRYAAFGGAMAGHSPKIVKVVSRIVSESYKKITEESLSPLQERPSKPNRNNRIK